MGSDRPDRAGRDSGDGSGPENRGNLLDEVVCDTTVGPPGSQDCILQIEGWKHWDFPFRQAPFVQVADVNSCIAHKAILKKASTPSGMNSPSGMRETPV